MTRFYLIAASALLLSACSRDYAPPPEASGEQMYLAACAECHKADENGAIFHLAEQNANATYVAHKVRSGSIMMPAFPNIKAEDFKKLSAYVLANSRTQ